jgi:uncharacterized protein (DUF1800 family)
VRAQTRRKIFCWLAQQPVGEIDMTRTIRRIALAMMTIFTLQPIQAQTTTSVDAFRLLQQASFGPTEQSIREVSGKGVRAWLKEQMALPSSQFSGRDRDQISKWSATYGYDYCRSLPEGSIERGTCGDQFISSNPVRRDFFKNASRGQDQLRQRIAFALSQILVISEQDLPGAGTYGLAEYFQVVQDNALGNYLDALRAVTLNPMMGRYLNLSNNDKQAPNENFPREMLQLFSIGTCELNINGTLKTGQCVPTFDNRTVRDYAHVMSGYTWPLGGSYPGQLYDWNPPYLRGRMVPVERYRDTSKRQLLSDVVVPANTSASNAMDLVFLSLEKHPNLAPFISKQFIQFLVTSNPSLEYVTRVSTAFNEGKFEDFGNGRRGDLKAFVAAILLDVEARSDKFSALPSFGMVRDPILRMTSAIRALNGYTDGEEMGNGWRSSGIATEQPFLNSPTVFGFYRPYFSLRGNSKLAAPQFQLITPNSVLGWVNFVDDLLFGWYGNGRGLAPKQNIPEAVGTKIDLNSFTPDASDPDKLAARLNLLLTGNSLGRNELKVVADAMKQIVPSATLAQSGVALERVRLASYLILSSPAFQTQK